MHRRPWKLADWFVIAGIPLMSHSREGLEKQQASQSSKPSALPPKSHLSTRVMAHSHRRTLQFPPFLALMPSTQPAPSRKTNVHLAFASIKAGSGGPCPAVNSPRLGHLGVWGLDQASITGVGTMSVFVLESLDLGAGPAGQVPSISWRQSAHISTRRGIRSINLNPPSATPRN